MIFLIRISTISDSGVSEGTDYEVDENGEFYRTADERKKASDTAYKASHSCSYSYFPQYNGTSDDGINANKPDGQAREFYDGLNMMM